MVPSFKRTLYENIAVNVNALSWCTYEHYCSDCLYSNENIIVIIVVIIIIIIIIIIAIITIISIIIITIITIVLQLTPGILGYQGNRNKYEINKMNDTYFTSINTG